MTPAGSGIFVLPAVIREGMGSTGAALVLWAVAAIVAMARLLVWLELGLTIPRYPGYGSVPRSGGDKNYVSGQMAMGCSAGSTSR